MKAVITTLFFLLSTSLFFNATAQVIYVDGSATGANTGENWDSAYVDLQSALAAVPAEGDTIWVAKGTYTPDTMNGNPAATFLIADSLVLLGGFNGTEESDTDRDPLENVTILSGDLNGDDVDSNYVSNRGDNVMTVVTIAPGITKATVIDGFTIRNGHADGTSGSQLSGAGIYASGAAPIIRQCVFEQNFVKEFGGGLYIGGAGSQGFSVEKCRFEKNWAIGDPTGHGGGMLVINVKGIGFSITGTEFNGNESDWTGGLSVNDSNGTVDSVTFSNNITTRHGGGMRLINHNGNNNLDFKVLNSNFVNNTAVLGGGMYIQQLGDNNMLEVDNCNFSDNSVAPTIGWTVGGGGLGIAIAPSSSNAQVMIDNCGFFDNSSYTNGSAIWTSLAGQNIDLNLNYCQFIENTAETASAAVDFWGTNGGSGSVLVDSCLFDGNVSFYSGALEIGNGWNGGAQIGYTVTNSTFKNNEATEGGAIGLWCSENSQTNILIDNCEIDNNVGTIRGGAIGLWPSSNVFNVNVSKCKIINNESPLGGAIDGYVFDPDVPIPESISAQFENCLIANNTSATAVITMDSITNFSLINCTVADNLSNAIQLSDHSGLNLQNTILYNPGYTEYEALDSNFNVTSLGGNLFGDSSLAVYALSYDLQDEDPDFEGSGDDCDYYQLSEDSPAIDKGMEWPDAPDLDLCGNERVINCIDIGALESEYMVASECNPSVGSNEVFVNESLIIFPNPAFDILNIQLPETITQAVEVSLFDFQGRLMSQQLITNNEAIDVGAFAPGMYMLKVLVGSRVYTSRFIKQ